MSSLREKIALMKTQFLQQKQQLRKTHKAAFWKVKERQIHEKYQMMKRQIKEIFILQKYHMLTRHEKKKEHDLVWFYNSKRRVRKWSKFTTRLGRTLKNTKMLR